MLTKLATFKGVTPGGEPLVKLFRQGDSITKTAGEMMPEIRDFLGTYKSDLKQIALLINALGASEHWGQNVNGDYFPWAGLIHDCRTHSGGHAVDDFTGRPIPPYGYPTFLEAHPFVHHKNKDPGRAFGSVPVSCINRKMRRVELVALVDRDLAAKYDAQNFVDRIDAGEFPDTSMGCRVPYDVCTICGNKSRTRDDYCACIKEFGMGFILPDGRKVGVINLHPRFFDISFVFVGADRTSKMMAKLGSEQGGLWVPRSILDADELYGEAAQPADGEGLLKAAAMIAVPGAIINTDKESRGAKLLKLMKHKEPPTLEQVLGIDFVVGPDPVAVRSVSTMLDNDRTSMGDGVLYTNAGEYAQDTKVASFIDSMLRSVGRGPAKPVHVVSEQSWECPHCRSSIPGRGGIFYDKTTDLSYHRPCVDKGPIELPYTDQGAEDMFGPLAKMATKMGPPPVPNRKEYPFVGTLNVKGLEIHVENDAGSQRSGKDPDGKPWSVTLKVPYGEIHKTMGSDEDKLDVYVGPDKNPKDVYVIHQNFVAGPKAGKYDEDKVMLGFSSPEEAKRTYLAHYNSDKFFRSMTTMPFDTFKDIIFGEVKGQKVAAMSKVAAELEDLFGSASSPNSVRRERTWRDKVTEHSTTHRGSGLGTSFSNMQKTAEEDAHLREIFGKAAQDKEADIDKELDPSTVNGRIIQGLAAREPRIPPALLDEMAAGDLQMALATPSIMGMVLKPDEFQRLILKNQGHTALADQLSAEGSVFPETEESAAPCGPLGPDNFSPDLMRQLMPLLQSRSFLGPMLKTRVIRISLLPTPPEQVTKETPLLSKVGAAYNWYRHEMLKVAAHAPSTVPQHPVLAGALCGLDDSSLFREKRASDPTIGAVLASVPLSLMYSASLRRDLRKGEDISVVKKIIAAHPNLTALGVAAVIRGVMEDDQIRQAVGNIMEVAAQTGRRVMTGSA
jgi:hypothetical protein